MDFGALCNFSGEKYHQEINIFKESEASRECAGELIRSLWARASFWTGVKNLFATWDISVAVLPQYDGSREVIDGNNRNYGSNGNNENPQKKNQKKLLPRCSISPLCAFI